MGGANININQHQPFRVFFIATNSARLVGQLRLSNVALNFVIAAMKVCAVDIPYTTLYIVGRVN